LSVQFTYLLGNIKIKSRHIFYYFLRYLQYQTFSWGYFFVFLVSIKLNLLSHCKNLKNVFFHIPFATLNVLLLRVLYYQLLFFPSDYYYVVRPTFICPSDFRDPDNSNSLAGNGKKCFDFCNVLFLREVAFQKFCRLFTLTITQPLIYIYIYTVAHRLFTNPGICQWLRGGFITPVEDVWPQTQVLCIG
jgi:hypothetical protein